MPKTYLQSGFSADGEPRVHHAVTRSDQGEVALTLYGADCSGNAHVRLTPQAWRDVIASLQAELITAEAEAAITETVTAEAS